MRPLVSAGSDICLFRMPTRATCGCCDRSQSVYVQSLWVVEPARRILAGSQPPAVPVRLRRDDGVLSEQPRAGHEPGRTGGGGDAARRDRHGKRRPGRSSPGGGGTGGRHHGGSRGPDRHHLLRFERSAHAAPGPPVGRAARHRVAGRGVRHGCAARLHPDRARSPRTRLPRCGRGAGSGSPQTKRRSPAERSQPAGTRRLTHHPR